MRLSIMAISALALLNGAVPATCGEMLIARDGKAMVKIVKPADCIPAEARAIMELTNYLAKVNGATFQIIEEKDAAANTPAIYVGATAYAKNQGIDITKLGKEESVIRTVGKDLIITGGRPRGALYGVYIFLEEALGVRWYTPWYTKIIRQEACKIKDFNIQREPVYKMRDHGGIAFSWDLDWEISKPYGEEWTWWVMRNRLNGPSQGRNIWWKSYQEYSPMRDDTGGGWVPADYGGFHTLWYYCDPQTYFEKHPEWFSMRGGVRVNDGKRFSSSGNHLCLTNKELQEFIKEKMLNNLRKITNANYVSFGVNDGGMPTFCDCPECRDFVKKNGTDTDLLLNFANPIADAIKKEFPDRYMVIATGYGPPRDPPKTLKASENIIFGGPRWDLPNERWAFLHYCIVSMHPYGYLWPRWWTIAEELKSLNEEGVTGIFAEDEIALSEPINSELYEMRTWIFAKLTENPRQDVDALIKDFVSGYFGAAGPFIFEYLMLQKENRTLWPWHYPSYAFIDKSQKLFDRALAAVARDPELLARVRETRINLDYGTLALRQYTIRDYLQHGGKLDDYPYKHNIIRDRLLNTLGNITARPYWRVKNLHVLGKRRAEPLNEVVAQWVNAMGKSTDYIPLPKEFEKITPGRMVEIPVGVVTRNQNAITNDPEAALGIAYSFSDTQLPYETGMYGFGCRPKGNIAEPRLLSRGDIKTGDNFHLYKCGRFLMVPQSHVYLHKSWDPGVYLTDLYDPKKPDQVWDWYVSLKVPGIDTNGNPTKLLLDRIFLVNVGNLEEVRRIDPAFQPVNMEILARWPFDGDGSDKSPPGTGVSNAEIKGGAWVEGRFGKALAFKNASDTALVAYDNKQMALTRQRLNFSDKSFTISLWFKTASSNNRQVLFEQRADNDHFLTLQIDGASTLSFQVFDSKANKKQEIAVSGKTSLTDEKWHHVVAGYDREKKSLFAKVDGGEVGRVTVAEIPEIEAPIRIGSGNGGYLDGALDEVVIYDQALPNLCGGFPAEMK